MATTVKVIVNFLEGESAPTWEPFGITDERTLAEWLNAMYFQMITWTGYDPCAFHRNQPLVFERFKNNEPVYDPNTRKANLPAVNSNGEPWFDTLEFFAYCLHELAHDFTRWDEQYCQQRVGIEPLDLAQYCRSPHSREIDHVVEALCEYFKKRLLAHSIVLAEGEDDWAQGVASIWARDWSDPREDIYTLEDGEPTNDAR